MQIPKSSLLVSFAILFVGLSDACRAAGNVTAAVVGFPPTLEITGDQEGNALAIIGDEDGTIRVIGLEDTGPGASKKGTVTTVNGGLNPFVVAPGTVLSLTVGLAGGDNMVSMVDVTIAFGAEIRTGDGDDTIRVERAVSVFIHAGRGRDTVVARDVSGSLIVGNDGNANDSMSVLIDHLTGSLDLVTVGGPDEIVLRDVETFYDIVVDTGAGNDHVILDNASILNLNTQFWMGGGNDWFQLLGHNTLASVAILLEEGNDLLDARLGTMDFFPQSWLRGGDGHDALLGADNLLGDLTFTLFSFEQVED